MSTVNQGPRRPTFPSVESAIPEIKRQKHFSPAWTRNEAACPTRVKRCKLRDLFQTCATPAATSTPGKLPERLRAQSYAEPPWQGLMFQVPLPSGHPPIHNPTNKNTLRRELPLSGQPNAVQTLQMLRLALLSLSLITSLIQTD